VSAHNGNQSAAAKELGCSRDQISKWSRGIHRVPKYFMDKMKNGNMTQAPPPTPTNIADKLKAQYPKCPPDLMELAVRSGGINPAARRSGVPAPELYKYARAQISPSERQQGRIDVALKAARTEENWSPPLRHPPPLSQRIPHDVTEFPPLLQQLIGMHGGLLVRAARAIGYRTASPLHKFRIDHADFTAEVQERVKKALRGEAVPEVTGARSHRSVEEDPDTGEMGIAIVLAKQSIIESIYDAGEMLGGKSLFRQRIGTDQWLVIFKLEDHVLKPFKALVRLVADKVVTP
jgi:hypothetical protein